jgi:hypothetical protein
VSKIFFFLDKGIITLILYFSSKYFFSISFTYKSSNVAIISSLLVEDEAISFPLFFISISGFFFEFCILLKCLIIYILKKGK